MTKTIKCPVCEAAMDKVNLPKQQLYSCKVCEELVQVLDDGSLFKMDKLLEMSARGDDRVHAAISRPTISTAKSFVDVLEAAIRSWRMDLGVATAELRAVLAQVENRLDFAMVSLAGMDLAMPELSEALDSIRQARELVSTLPANHRGLPKEGEDDLSTFTIQTARADS